MTVDPTIFRQYDIRGIVDEQLTESTVEQIGQAFATYACERGAKIVTVGQDCRDHSPRMVEALQKGLATGGLDVIDLGTVTTPMQYFSIFHFDADGGIEVTGSHNPPEYNGLKLSLGGGAMHGDAILALRDLILEKKSAAGRRSQ